MASRPIPGSFANQRYHLTRTRWRRAARVHGQSAKSLAHRLGRLRSSGGNAALELVLGVSGFAVILLPAVSALSEVAASRALADDAAMAIARAWSSSDTIDRKSAADQVAGLLEGRSARRLRALVTCDGDCALPSTTGHVLVSVATGLRYPATVFAARQVEGDRYAP